MATMQATKTFEGPKGTIKKGQIVDVNDKIAASWNRQGLADFYTGQNMDLSNKKKEPDNQPSITSTPGTPGTDDAGKNTENKSTSEPGAKDETKDPPTS